jgi:flagellar biosynthesis/type III secretory pathway ATPase
VQVGEYKKGSDPLADLAIDRRTAINSFLQQAVSERTPAAVAWEQLQKAVEEN